MRTKNQLLSSVGSLLAAIVAPIAMLGAQDPVRVDVHTPETNTVWYADPFWIGVGIVAVLVIILLSIAASRRGGGSTTTIVR